jgi:hypothetical protein
MLRILLYCLLCTCLALSCAQQKIAQLQQNIPAAVPVAKMFTAAKNGDARMMKSLHSWKVQRWVGQHDVTWEEVTGTYDEQFSESFGDYSPADFEFLPVKKDGQIKVRTLYRNKIVGQLRVVKQDGQWKIDELI